MYKNYFTNKIALVTGGGSGIGRGLCLELGAAGASVICTDINFENAKETVSQVKGKAEALKLDVTDQVAFESLIAGVVTRYGRLDLIFNNAGIAVSGELRDIPLNDWKKLMDINFYGVLYGSQAAYQVMLKQGSGQIVNIASAAGLADRLALMAPYSVSKHAVVNYTHILRLEAKELGVKANVVCPGFVGSSIGKNAISANAKPGWDDKAINEVAKGIKIEKAAREILKGVTTNKETIIFPSVIKLLIGPGRFFGGLITMIMKKALKDFRQNYRINN